MVTSHFLKFIDIINFKCFHDFKVDKLERVNLISGKNNIGKTAFMEVCFINSKAINIKSLTQTLYSIKFMRENMNILVDGLKLDIKKVLERFDNILFESNLHKVEFKIFEEQGAKYYQFNEDEKVLTNTFTFDFIQTPHIQFIDSFGFSNKNIISNYASIQQKDQENYLNTILKDFDATIEGFKVFNNLPQCKVNEQWLEITELGDGVRHVISIITALFQSENGYLFIDELGNGIHYTYLDKIWEIIFKLSKELNCQVFVTTHSKECIEAFNQQNSDNEGGYFEFYRSKKTDAITYKKRNNEQLSYSLSHNGEFRGE
jgi:AAA15 family ATPase/GTPase